KGPFRQGAALALHPRGQGAGHGRDLPQHGSGRRVGELGRSEVCGEVVVVGISDRDELFCVRFDALMPELEKITTSARLSTRHAWRRAPLLLLVAMAATWGGL